MSRAFVREADGDTADSELPDRSLGDQPSYVTPDGLVALRRRVTELEASRRRLLGDEALGMAQSRRELERDLRYYNARLAAAQVVQPDPAAGRVRIGCEVTVDDERSVRSRYRIVGEDEADVARGWVSWISPLARALLGHAVGDTVRWERPGGAIELELIAIDA